MKISMSVMIILTTLFLCGTIFMVHAYRKNATRKKEKLFKDAIKGENLSFNNKEQWNNNFIGLDESQNV